MVNNNEYENGADAKYHKAHLFNSFNSQDLTDIGEVVASSELPITMDGFWFALNAGVLINTFDFVTVENLFNSKTIGIVKELQTVVTDKSCVIHGKLPKERRYKPSTEINSKTIAVEDTLDDDSYFGPLHAITLAKVDVMANTGFNSYETGNTVTISMPVQIQKNVKFSTADEIMFALGIPNMLNPIPAGVLETTNRLQVPISLDVSYLAGPDTAHVNASGISGNLKSTYVLFLLQSAYQRLKDHNVSLIILNTKESELLQIDKLQKDVKERNEKLFDLLKLQISAFNNVTYFLPRGKDGKPNSAYIPKNHKTYSYELADIYDRLDLLFPDVYDTRYNLQSIIDYIYESWPIKDGNKIKIRTWTDLFEYNDYPENIVSNKSSLLHFRGHLQRFRKSPMFTDKKVTSVYLGREIKNIQSGDVFVIDVGMISSLEEQSFIVGDVMKSINETYSAAYYKEDNNHNGSGTKKKRKNKVDSKRPDFILIFLDEINRFIPSTQTPERMDPVAEQIMRILISGKLRRTILFSAQQFKSSTDHRLHENTGLHVTAKLGLSELSSPPYSMLDESTKRNIARLNKGELVMIHSAFRHPIKISFPSTKPKWS